MHGALRGFSGVEVIADEKLVYGCDDTLHEAIKDHDVSRDKLLQRARKSQPTLHCREIATATRRSTIHGAHLTSNGLKIYPAKVEAVKYLRTPTDKQSTQRILGFVNLLTQYLPSLSDVSEPLRRLTETVAIFTWPSQQENALK